MSPGNEQGEIGEFRAVSQSRGQRVARKMVYTQQRFPASRAQSLGERYPRQQPADEPGAGGHGYRIGVIQRPAGLGKRLFKAEVEPLGVRAGGEFRHDSAIFGMKAALAVHDRRQDIRRLADFMANDRRCGVVATALETENCQGAVHQANSLRANGPAGTIRH